MNGNFNTQAQRFIIGLEKLTNECDLTQVSYNAFGPLELIFNDGSSVGMIRAFMDANLIDEDNYKEKYINFLDKK